MEYTDKSKTTDKKKFEFIKHIHYYVDNDRVIFTENYHIQRGYCCGNGCKHCPFDPKHIRDNTKIQKLWEKTNPPNIEN